MTFTEFTIRDEDTGELVYDGFATCTEAVEFLEDGLMLLGIANGHETIIGNAEDFA